MNDESGRRGTRVVVGPYPGPMAVTPSADEVRVCVIQLDAPPVAIEELHACLTPDEKVRAERYKVATARHQFVTGRGLLRQLLGTCLGVGPVEVPLAYTGAGKPVLADASRGIHFNVTHTDGLALIALARQPVGVDVERLRVMSDPEGLVGRFFSAAERDTYLGLPAELRTAGFFRGWTCKEAVIKASGLSVAYLDEFDVELHPNRPAELLAARHPVLVGTKWRLTAWEPAGGYAAALAVEGSRDVWMETSENDERPR